jgi:hypothetical protein
MNSTPATIAPTSYAAQTVEQDDWRRSDLAPATGRLRPVSSSFLASESGGNTVRASAQPTKANDVVRAEYRETSNRLNWQQPGTSAAATAPAVTSSSQSRVELSALPRNASAGNQVSARSSSASPSRILRTAAPVSHYGFSHDYRWLKGQLEYSAAQRQWKLRYIPIDGQTDRYGGSVVLESVPALSNYRNGDFIQVQGVVRGQDTASSPYAAAYRISRLARLK